VDDEVTGIVILGELKIIEASGLRLVTVIFSRSFVCITGSVMVRVFVIVVS
jgi:hypothetical protein